MTYGKSVFADKRFGLEAYELDDDVCGHEFQMLPEKKRPSRRSPTRPNSLQAGDVRCLQALGAAGHFEFNRLAFVQRFVAFRLNRGKVDKNVLAGLALDEPKTLASIEPLHSSLFSH